jgi:hypothetical protein
MIEIREKDCQKCTAKMRCLTDEEFKHRSLCGSIWQIVMETENAASK